MSARTAGFAVLALALAANREDWRAVLMRLLEAIGRTIEQGVEAVRDALDGK